MKNTYTLLIVLLIAVGSATAATVSRGMPDRIAPGTTATVTLTASGLTANDQFTLEETLPPGTKLLEWNVVGSKEDKSSIQTRVKDQSNAWSFTTTGDSATITYKVQVLSSTKGIGEFTAVYFDKSGFNKGGKSVTFTAASTETPKPAAQPPTTPAAQPEPASTPAEQIKTPTPAKSSSSWWIAVLVLVIVGLVAYFWMGKKPTTEYKRR